jgi:hypothetical protein
MKKVLEFSEAMLEGQPEAVVNSLFAEHSLGEMQALLKKVHQRIQKEQVALKEAFVSRYEELEKVGLFLDYTEGYV